MIISDEDILGRCIEVFYLCYLSGRSQEWLIKVEIKAMILGVPEKDQKVDLNVAFCGILQIQGL